MKITEAEFFALWVEESTEVASMFYPGLLGPDEGRGEYLRDQGVLYSRLLARLEELGIVT
jgi:hypothetical protein